jgi:hypothetical protein
MPCTDEESNCTLSARIGVAQDHPGLDPDNRHATFRRLAGNLGKLNPVNSAQPRGAPAGSIVVLPLVPVDLENVGYDTPERRGVIADRPFLAHERGLGLATQVPYGFDWLKFRLRHALGNGRFPGPMYWSLQCRGRL